MLPFLALPALLLTLTAVLGLLNRLTLKLPMTIGLVLFALLAALGVMGLDVLLPGLGLGAHSRSLLSSIDFNKTLMQGLLSFLLFAGAMHVDLPSLWQRKGIILLLATVGVLISTVLNGFGFWALTQAFGMGLPFMICLVFGALISPTDPVAVLAVLKRQTVPASLEAKIAGESLFNDGVAVVVFSLLVGLAFGDAGGHGGEAGHAPDFSLLAALGLFAQEAFGGIALGLVAGYIAYLGIRAVDDYVLDVIITLALVMGAYSLAIMLHLSGPLAMVIAGLFIGNQTSIPGISAMSRKHLEHFWELMDEVLNAVLFLLIGFEIMIIGWSWPMVGLILTVIPLVLVVRYIAVGLPVQFIATFKELTPGAPSILTWAGLRGGISVALALSLPAGPERDLMLAVAYGVVVFSIITQGLTIEHLIRAKLGQARKD